jgi:hypothetical protein
MSLRHWYKAERIKMLQHHLRKLKRSLARAQVDAYGPYDPKKHQNEPANPPPKADAEELEDECDWENEGGRVESEL